MRQISKVLVGLMLTFMAVLPMQAQQESTAFYIYQNDGHFDGFFYDEVEKICYSFLDTLGIEHDEIVSQEIVTADSTYRIMLSAIDSVGFVQPEIKYNPRLHIVKQDAIFSYVISVDDNFETIVLRNDLPEILMPRVGDSFAHFDNTYGWSAKAVSVNKAADGTIVVQCKPIDDITDIFQQFVSIEEYGYNDEGHMIRRRVAGRPDLSVGKTPKKASGTWEGDLFNFSISGHIPLYDKDDLTITIDPTISGKLNVKTAWNLSLWGDKYIGITSTLNLGVGLVFTVDGKIDEYFPGGIGGLLGGVPIPAACPLIMLDITPDAFLRGDAHVKFSASTPVLNGAIWEKLEINNWIPYMSIGIGKPNGDKFKYVSSPQGDLSLELNGFIQGGLWFPLQFKSLPLIKNFFDASIGGNMFVGPKLAGSIKLDLTTLPTSDVATYTLLKNTTLSFHPVDADFEIKAKVKTAFSGKKEMTLLDGGISLFPPIDAALAPEFGDFKDVMTEQVFTKEWAQSKLGSWSGSWDKYEGTSVPCRVISIEPTGTVVMPSYVGLAMFAVREDGTEVEVTYGGLGSATYFPIMQWFGQPVPETMSPKLYIIYDSKIESGRNFGGKYKVRPYVNFYGRRYMAEPCYEFDESANYKLNSDILKVNYDGSCLEPIRAEGEISRVYVKADDSMTNERLFLESSKQGENVFDITINKNSFNSGSGYGKNYSVSDTIKIDCSCFGYSSIGNAETSTQKAFKTIILPNADENPSTNFDTYDDEEKWLRVKDVTWTRIPKGWHGSAKATVLGRRSYELSFDLEESSTDAGLWQDYFLKQKNLPKYTLRGKRICYDAMGELKEEKNINTALYLNPITGKFSVVYGGDETSVYNLHFDIDSK